MNTLEETIAEYQSRIGNNNRWFDEAQEKLKAFQMQYQRDKPQEGDDPGFAKELKKCRYYSRLIKEYRTRIGIIETTRKTLEDAKQFCAEPSPHAFICLLRNMKQDVTTGISDVPRYERILRSSGENHTALRDVIASFNKEVFRDRTRYEQSLNQLAATYIQMVMGCRDEYMRNRKK